jgi:hypothetical protein
LARFPLAALAFAVFAFLGCFAGTLALLARSGAVAAAPDALPPSSLWIAFQMRATADFRSVNFLTGVRPGMPFQTSISRLAGHLAARSANSCWLANISPSKFACRLSRAVMPFSASMLNVAIFASPDRRCGHGIHRSEARNKQVNSADCQKKNPEARD